MSTKRLLQRPSVLLAALSLVVVLALVGCVSTGVRDYEGWRAAVDHGEPCSRLYEIRHKLPTSVDRAKVDADLAEIGCNSPQAIRTDR